MSEAKTKTWIIAAVVLAAAALGLYLIRRPHEAAPAAIISGAAPTEPAGQASSQDAAAPESSAKAALRLGTPQLQANHELKVPLHFTAAKGEKVGNIHVELQLSSGSWVFEDGSAPDGAKWDLTAEKAAPDADAAEKKAGEVIDVDIDGNGRSIRNGLVGFLTFKVQGDTPTKEIPAAVANLETWPPENSSGSDGSGSPDASDKPGELSSGQLNPALGCFFFTH